MHFIKLSKPLDKLNIDHVIEVSFLTVFEKENKIHGYVVTKNLIYYELIIFINNILCISHLVLYRMYIGNNQKKQSL